jgi:hypothetical protein
MQKMFPETAIMATIVVVMEKATLQTGLLTLPVAEAAQEFCRTNELQDGGTLAECVDKKEEELTYRCQGSGMPPCHETHQFPKSAAIDEIKTLRESCKDEPDTYSCEKVKSDSTPGF